MLNLDKIRERLGPNFIPFTLHLTNGRSFEIPHPDFIAVGRGIVSVIDDRDITHTIDPLHIVSIEDHIQKRRSSAKRAK